MDVPSRALALPSAPNADVPSGHGDIWRTSMTTTNENFVNSIDGALTPEQPAQAFTLAEQGDTDAKQDAGDAPTTTAATDNTSTDAHRARR